MTRNGMIALALIVGPASLLAACATSDDATGGAGTGGTTASGGAAGSDGGGTGGSGATGGGAGAAGTSGAAGASGAAGGGGMDGGTGGSEGGLTGSITGRIEDLLTANDPNPTYVSGLSVCVYQDSSIPCATTDSQGAYTLANVPADQDLLLEYQKTGYFPTLVTVHTVPGVVSLGLFLAPTTAAATAFATLVGVTLDPNKGQVLFTAFQPASGGGYTGQDSVVGAITPKTGTGPFYTNNNNPPLPDTTATATSANGIGLFANVDPGDAEVTLTHFSKTCTRLSTAWPGVNPNGSKIKIVAGYLTGGAAVECP
jgi:hypothetical protein